MTRHSHAQALRRPHSPRHNPLPYKNGVGATRLHLPDAMPDGSEGTVADYLIKRFGHVEPDDIFRRFRRKEVVGAAGVPVTAETPLTEHAFIWYYRELPEEKKLPVDIKVLYQDKHLIVIDKPAFLPTTPGGKYVQESALIRLRTLLGENLIVPVHRLDRQTSGLLLFSRSPKTRGAYQQLFERRAIEKTYEAVAAYDPGIRFPQHVRSRIRKTRGVLRAEEITGEPNAASTIEISRIITTPHAAPDDASLPGGTAAVKGRSLPRKALYRLTPHTGKTHQLRLHMTRLSIPILNDPFYPSLQEDSEDDYRNPLQLLAKALSFTDPLTGQQRTFSTTLSLGEATAGHPPDSGRAV